MRRAAVALAALLGGCETGGGGVGAGPTFPPHVEPPDMFPYEDFPDEDAAPREPEPVLGFHWPADPLDPLHPFPTTKHFGPDGVAIPARWLDPGVPDGPDADRLRPLFARVGHMVATHRGASPTAVVRVPHTGGIAVETLEGAVLAFDDDSGAAIPVRAKDTGQVLEIRPVGSWGSGTTVDVMLERSLRGTDDRPCARAPGLLPPDRMRRFGLDADRLCLAFDFPVADIGAEVRALRDAVVQRAAANRPSYRIDRVVPAAEVPGLEASETVERVAYGTFDSPEFRNDSGLFDASRLDSPETAPAVPLQFALALPRRDDHTAPLPVVIGLHGLNSDIEHTLPPYADYLASRGFAYLTIDGAAHGSRRVDMRPPMYAFLDFEDPRRSRDLFRQTQADLLQLRLTIAAGIEVGEDRLETSSVRWSGGSYGGIFGTIMSVVDPALEAVHVEGCGGPWRDVVLTNPQAAFLFAGEFRSKTGVSLRPDQPELYDVLARYFELAQWVIDPGDVSALAALARRAPLDGRPRRILMQYWVGEQLMTNEASRTLVAALGLPEAEPTEDPLGVAGAWPYDVTAWGIEPSIEAHQSFWMIPEARTQALDFLESHGTRLAAP